MQHHNIKGFFPYLCVFVCLGLFGCVHFFFLLFSYIEAVATASCDAQVCFLLLGVAQGLWCLGQLGGCLGAYGRRVAGKDGQNCIWQFGTTPSLCIGHWLIKQMLTRAPQPPMDTHHCTWELKQDDTEWHVCCQSMVLLCNPMTYPGLPSLLHGTAVIGH